jgi:hypothetical protein
VQRFRAPVTKEGSKSSSMRVTVPKRTVAAAALSAPCWVRTRVNDGEWFFAWARRPPSRNSVDVGLTQRLFPLSLAGNEIDVDIESAEPYRAREWTDSRGFDWLPLVDQAHYFPTETIDGKLALHNRHEEPFVMWRVTRLLETYRMLGLYQAEGSKSPDAPDFSMANSNPRLLAHAVELLSAWGLDRSRLSLEVLRAPGEDPVSARAVYTPVGVEIVAERVRTGAGGRAAVLHVRKSMPLSRLVKAALAKLFVAAFPSVDTAREYALGWIDGDANLIINPTSIELRLAGGAEEHEVLKRALATAFGWTFDPGAYWRDFKQGTHITLRAHEMLDLIESHAFSLSMNRARLLVAFDQRTEKLRTGEWRAPGALIRWGLLASTGALTALGERICAGHVRWADEIKKARQLLAAAPKGVKGLPYC